MSYAPLLVSPGTPDPNVWYLFNNTHTGAQLASGFNNNGTGKIYVTNSTNSTIPDYLLWQVAPVPSSNGPTLYMFRPKAYGNGTANKTSYCMNAIPCAQQKTKTCSQIPLLEKCSNDSIIWQLGLFFVNQTPEASTILTGIYNTTSKQSAGLAQIPGSSETNVTDIVPLLQANGGIFGDYAAWNATSISQINDKSWSTFPAGVGSSLAGHSITTSNTASTTSTTMTMQSIFNVTVTATATSTTTTTVIGSNSPTSMTSMTSQTGSTASTVDTATVIVTGSTSSTDSTASISSTSTDSTDSPSGTSSATVPSSVVPTVVTVYDSSTAISTYQTFVTVGPSSASSQTTPGGGGGQSSMVVTVSSSAAGSQTSMPLTNRGVKTTFKSGFVGLLLLFSLGNVLYM